MAPTPPRGGAARGADNHQLIQPLFISELQPGLPHVFKEVGLGFQTVASIPAEQTRMATTCAYKDKP